MAPVKKRLDTGKNHDLDSADHFFEAAVAHYRATGALSSPDQTGVKLRGFPIRQSSSSSSSFSSSNTFGWATGITSQPVAPNGWISILISLRSENEDEDELFTNVLYRPPHELLGTSLEGFFELETPVPEKLRKIEFPLWDLAAVIDRFEYVEYDEATIPGIDSSHYRIVSGKLEVPDLPGFGLLLDDELFSNAVAENGFAVPR